MSIRILLIGLALASAVPAGVSGEDLTATMVQRVQGGTIEGKFYLKGPRCRLDLLTPAPETRLLIDPAASEVTFLSPEKKRFSKAHLKLEGEVCSLLSAWKEMGERRPLGSELVGGVIYRKYELSAPEQAAEKTIVWADDEDRARKLWQRLPGGAVVETEWLDIRGADLDRSLFEVPPDYRPEE